MDISDGKRRHLVVAFSDICGSTDLSLQMEPEDYSSLLQGLRIRVKSIVEKHGGTVIRIDGDGFLYIFGHPIFYEDIGRRATEAALDIHDAATGLFDGFTGVDLAMHTGIHSGIVLLSEGDIVRGKYDVLGETTNIASRLCELADRSCIFIDEPTLGVDRHFFKTEALGSVNLRGVSQPLAVQSVKGRNFRATRLEARQKRGVAPFTGRATELGQIHRAISNDQLIIVTAPAGLGKTRLLDEIERQFTPMRSAVLRGYCESYFQSSDMQPFQQIAGSRSAREYFDTLIGSSEAAILLIDDWQWADNASRDFLPNLLRRASGQLTVILASREPPPPELQEFKPIAIRLSALDPTESQQTIQNLIKAPAPFLVETIVQNAGGNPLFIEELCHAANNREVAAEQGDHALTDKNAWLAALILARFSKLDASTAAIARAASVIGHIIPLQTLKEVIQISSGDNRLLELAEKDFIFEGDVDGTLQFKHIIARDVIYRTVGLSDRKRLHGRVADIMRAALQDTPSAIAESLPHHLARSGQSALAEHYAVQLGDKALEAGSLDRAQRNFKLALEQVTALSNGGMREHDLASLIARLGMASIVDPGHDQLPVLRRAAAIAVDCKDERAEALAEYYLGFIQYGLGCAKKAIFHLRRAKLLGAKDQKFSGQLSALLGEAMAAACDYRSAEHHLEIAISSKRPHVKANVPSPGMSYALSCKAFLLADRGAFDESRMVFKDAKDVLAGHDHQMLASLYSQRAAACYWEGRHQEGLDYAEAALSFATRSRARYLHAMTRALIAVGRLEMDGSDEDAFQQLVETSAWLESSASRQYLSLNHGWLAREYARRNDVHRTRRHTILALQRAREGDRLGEAMAWRAMARLSATLPMKQTPEHCMVRARRSAFRRGSRHEAHKNQQCYTSLGLAAKRGSISTIIDAGRI